MTAFEIAMNSLFTDPNIAVDAVFTPSAGVPKSVRVIQTAPDAYGTIGQSVFETATTLLAVRVADCPTVAQGDTFTINSVIYKVQSEPRRNSDRLVWEMDCYAA
jgi:hypothetical protein